MKIWKYLLVSATVLSLVSCESLLEQEPLNQPALENFYSNQAEATLGVNAIYTILAGTNTYNRAQVAFAMMEDHTYQSIATEWIQISQVNYQPNNAVIFNWYRSCYLGIARANFAINRILLIPAAQINATVQKRLIAEAKFLRGLYYFHLVRLFGEVPIVLNPTESLEEVNIPKAAETEVWAQVEKDFSEAIPDLPAKYTGADVGRATSGAAKIFLAQAYQWQKKTTQALALVNDVVNSKAYSLHANYVDNFLESKENGVESIFAIQYKDFQVTSGNQNATWVKDIGVRGTQNRINSTAAQPGFGYLYANSKLLSNYETGDVRREVTFWENGKVSPATSQKFNAAASDALMRSSTDVAPMKWWWNDQGYTGRGENLDLIRYADVLLMQAELINEVEGPTPAAYTAINAVRTRAKLPNLAAGLSKDDFFKAVLKERHVELMFEFQRWWDLARTKTAEIYYKAAAGKESFNPTKHYKWPLPAIALERNKALKQNPAYE